MKIRKPLIILGLIVGVCASAQMPIFRNSFTTNLPGAYVRGHLAFGDAGDWYSGLTATGRSIFMGPFWHGGPAGTSSVSIGFNALTNMEFATAVGSLAGQHATQAVHGTFIGRSAGQWITNGESPTVIGANSALRAYHANHGVFLGAYAGYRAEMGTNATMVGRNAGLYASNTPYATFIGHGAGRTATNAPYATFLGAQTGPDPSLLHTNVGNSVAIGYSAKVTDTNQMILGTGQFVGINTNRPGVSLDVHGTVNGTNVTVWPPRWDDVRIPLGALSSPASTPGRVTFRGGLTVYGFDDASTEQLNFELQLPHGITTNAAYGIHMHIHWTCTNAIAGANSNVVWGLEYVIADPLTLYSTTTITNRITNAIPAPFFHMLGEWPAITVNIKESAVMIGRLFREGGNGSDTLAGDAMGLSLDAHYPRISFGSTGEYGDY